MKDLRRSLLTVCLVVVVGCSGRPPRPQQTVHQPRERVVASSDLVGSLTVEQIRKANAGGLAYPELTAGQQQAVSQIWSHYAERMQAIIAEGTPGRPAGAVEKVRIVMVGYAKAEGEYPWTVHVEFQEGQNRCMVGYPANALATAVKEAGKDMVAAGIAIPRSEAEEQGLLDEQ